MFNLESSGSFDERYQSMQVLRLMCLRKIQYMYFNHVRDITIILYYCFRFCCCIRTQVLKKCI